MGVPRLGFWDWDWDWDWDWTSVAWIAAVRVGSILVGKLRTAGIAHLHADDIGGMVAQQSQQVRPAVLEMVGAPCVQCQRTEAG